MTNPIDNKRDFIRGMPNATPKEIVEAAKKVGIIFKTKYVYNVRGIDRATFVNKKIGATKTASKPAAKRPAKTHHAVTPKTRRAQDENPLAGSHFEASLRRLAAEVGMQLAQEALQTAFEREFGT